jgi:outer membrane protein assembly factor BamB
MMSKSTLRSLLNVVGLLVVMLTWCGATQPAAAGDADTAAFWLRFHGPDGDNISPDTGLLRSWPEGGPGLVWTASGIGYGYSSVTVADGRIFTAGNVDRSTMVTAIDLGNGRIIWQAENGAAWTGSYDGSRGTPTIDGDRVYHQSPLGQLSCFNAADGKKLWTVDVLERFGAENIRWGLAESVLVDGDHVITCPGGSRASIAALDKRTGGTVWTAPGTGTAAGYASPIVVEQDGLRMIITMNAEAVIAVNAATGKLLWQHPHATSYDVNATMPIYHDGQVLISSGYGSGSVMLAIAVEGDSAGAKKVWESTALDNQHGGVLLLDGFIYGSVHKGRGSWACLDWRTGELKYAEKGVGMGSLTAADGLLVTLSEKNTVGLVKATPDGHEVISSFELPEQGKGASWAHPVVIGGRLYIRHSDYLYAYAVVPEG